MPKFRAKVYISLRPSVLDPAGEASKSAANRLGIDGISKIRIGKSITVELNAINQKEAKKDIEFLSDRLLANPVIENWDYHLEEIKEES